MCTLYLLLKYLDLIVRLVNKFGLWLIGFIICQVSAICG